MLLCSVVALSGLEQCPSAAGCWRSGSVPIVPGGFVCERSRGTPPSSCRFPLLALRTWSSGASFRAGFIAGPGADGARGAPKEYRGGSVFRMWNISVAGGQGAADEAWPPRCAATLSDAVLFTIPYGARYAGKSNYYHMHVDVLLPLMTLLDRRQRLRTALDDAVGGCTCSAAMARMPAPGQRTPIDVPCGRVPCGREGSAAAEPPLLPAVSELSWPLEDDAAAPGGIDWGTDAFEDGSSYWVAALQAMSGTALLPLTSSAMGALLRGRGVRRAAGGGEARVLCLRDAVLGLPGSGAVPEDGPELLARHVRARLHMPLVQLAMPTLHNVLPRVAFVSRCVPPPPPLHPPAPRFLTHTDTRAAAAAATASFTLCRCAAAAAA